MRSTSYARLKRVSGLPRSITPITRLGDTNPSVFQAIVVRRQRSGIKLRLLAAQVRRAF
jgi:hypothetical protein